MGKTLIPFVAAGTLLFPLPVLLADGTETLGIPSIAIQSGTEIIAGGTGLYSQPGTIELAVPSGATVRQVLLYWDGASHQNLPADSTILVEGTQVTGTLIGGPTGLFTDPSNSLTVQYASYRADITSLGLVQPGENTLTVSGLENSFANDGAGVLVIIQEGSDTGQISVRDGIDWAYWKQSGDLAVTSVQTFTFASANVARQASLTLFVGSVDQNRPNQVRITVNGQTTILENPLFSNEGDQWDTLVIPVNLAAGASSLAVELVSSPVDNELGGGASLVWVTAALVIAEVPQAPPPEPENPGTRTPGYWKNHPDAWPQDTIQLGGQTYLRDEAIQLMNEPTKGDKTFNLVEHLIAAKLNVAVGNDSSCVDQAIADADAFLQTHPVGSGVAASSEDWKSVESTFSTLSSYNEGHLCVPHADEGSPSIDGGQSRPAFTHVAREGRKLKLRWEKGSLEAADSANGPWVRVPNASNPADVPVDGTMKFYRLR